MIRSRTGWLSCLICTSLVIVLAPGLLMAGTRCYRDLPNPELIVTGWEDYEVRGQEFRRFLLEVQKSICFP